MASHAHSAFSDPRSSRTQPLSWNEPHVHWFTDITRPEAATSRDVVNSWYRDFPDRDGRLLRRLRSQRDTEHFQAIDELYVHHLLREGHEDVRHEEGDGAPDFRVYERGALLAAVEVVSLFQPDVWEADERRHARLADQLNVRVRPTAGYWVDFDIEYADRDPPPGPFASFVRLEVAKLPPHEQGTTFCASYNPPGIQITVTFIPMAVGSPLKSDPSATIVAAGGGGGGLVTAAQRLKDRVSSKAGGRYEIEGVPFAVAVGVHDWSCTNDQVHEALYGPTADGTSLFGVDKERPEGRYTRLSAVVVVADLHVWEPDAADVAVYDNSHARRRLPDSLLAAVRRA